MQWRCLGRVFYLPRKLLVVLAGVLCVGVLLGGYFLLSHRRISREDVIYSNNTALVAEATVTAQKVAEVTPKTVLWEIYIVGAVQHPGIYALEEGALVHDAVEAAGGLLPSAEPETVNMVQELQDNLMIHILTGSQRIEQGRDSSLVLTKNGTELGGGQTDGENNSGETAKININSATKEVLMTLPGIGDAKAESILAYRQEHGPFQTIEEIMLVSGIKESAFAKIKDRITT